MKTPIHKFNNGNSATLCCDCGVIITEGITDDLYCKKCELLRNEIESAIRTTLLVLNKQSMHHAVDKIMKLKLKENA
jgi:hypothetical protein